MEEMLVSSEHAPGSGCLVISEDTDGLEEPMELHSNKIEVEPVDALVYFQV